MLKKENMLIVLVGPTAVGKTSLSIEIAKALKTEIISGDSRQFFREMNIGTAKPSASELKLVKHHFVNSLSIEQYYDVGKYEVDVLQALEQIFKQHTSAVLVGGSGLYIKAVCEGFDDIPTVSVLTRQHLNERLRTEGLESLIRELQEADPEYYREVDQNNGHRVVRALEVILETGKPFSSFRKGLKKDRPFKIVKIGLERPREELYNIIDKRMDAMIQEGLFDEARSLYIHRNKNALQTVGYKEIFDFLDGQYDKNEAIRLLKRNSRRYAKRQLTWFKKDPEIQWYHPDQIEGIMMFIRDRIIE